jgi:hypothetical protein
MKKIVAGLGIVAMAFVFTSAAGAASIDGVNDDSTASITSSFVLRLLGNTSSDFTVHNTVKSSANTGGNSITADEDVEDASIQSGDAGAASLAETTGGDVDVDVDVDADNNRGGDSEINDVDDDSDADIDSETTIEHDMDVTSSGEVRNHVDASADAGANSISSKNDDVEGADIETGEAVSASAARTEFGRIMQQISWN